MRALEVYRRRTVLLFLIGLVSLLNSVFVFHESKMSGRRPTSHVKLDTIQDDRTAYRQVIQNHVPDKSREKTNSGYSLATRVWERCRNMDAAKTTLSPKVKVFSVYASHNDSVQVCGIWKIGTTFIKRLFMLLNDKTYVNEHNVYTIPFNVVEKHVKTQMDTRLDKERFLFVRNPYIRVYSAYVDKVLAPNPVFWKYIGVPGIKYMRKNPTEQSLRCGHDLTFKEFVSVVILTLKLPGTKGKPNHPAPDAHTEIMDKMCKSCEVNYTFIGKMETFKEDSIELVHHLGMTKTEQLLAENGVALAADDAIRDTTNQPFDKEFQKGFARCMSKRQTLERAWTKLQARGLIGRESLTIQDTHVDTLTREEFVGMAKKARDASTSKERKLVKEQHFNMLYDTVTYNQLNELRSVYATDFRLFEYDDTPDWLFSRTRQMS